MGENKRYYWLKLKKDFFDSKEMKKLRKFAGGDTYTIIYLKMQLLSLADEGKLYFDGVEDSFADEIALQIGEDSENVRMTFAYLQKVGLMELRTESELFLTDVPYMIGTETDKAAIMRKKREQKKQNVLDTGNNVTQQLPNSSPTVTKSYTEIEIEKDIDTEIEKEKDIDTESEKREKRKEKNAAKAASLGSLVVEYTENLDLRSSLFDFIDQRRAMKSPMTVKALQMLLKKLDGLASTDKEKIEILQESTINGWKSVYPLKKGSEKNGRNDANRKINQKEDPAMARIEATYM